MDPLDQLLFRLFMFMVVISIPLVALVGLVLFMELL